MRIQQTKSIPARPDITGQCGTIAAPDTRTEELLFRMLQRSEREVARLQKLLTDAQKTIARFYAKGVAKKIAKQFIPTHLDGEVGQSRKAGQQ
jgi:hypothetical protein